MTAFPQRPSLPRLTTHLALFLAFTACVWIVGSTSAHAQSQSGASKSMNISAFAAYINSDPDYGSLRNNGGMVGVDFSRYFHQKTEVSFEVRGVYTSGQIVDERSILGGLRFSRAYQRYHPYADIMAGNTQIDFNVRPSPNYSHDSAFALAYGGGVNIDVARNFQAMIDFQEYSLNFGSNGTQPGNADFTLTPTFFTIGVVYRIPFRPHNRQSDKH